jgi:hypothetical protein
MVCLGYKILNIIYKGGNRDNNNNNNNNKGHPITGHQGPRG